MLDFVRKNLDLLSAALDAMPEKVLVLDRAGFIVLTNTAWRSLWRAGQGGAQGFGPGETMRSLNILDLEHEDTADFLSSLDRVATGRIDTLTRICRSSGADAALWYRLRAARIHIGRWTGVVVTMDDVSDAHRVRQAIRRLSLRLNRLQQQERERIALELHDSTAQHLVAASLNLAGVRSRMSLTGRDAAMFDDIERSLQSAMHEVQMMSFGLYPPHLSEGDLDATLERFVRTYARQTGIRTALHAPKLDWLPLKTQQTLLRVAQEALTNVHRHAAASHASVRLRITRESVLLCIADNGKGMDLPGRADAATAGTGIGLSGMYARVDQLGGALRVKSRRGQGTRILAQIPLPRVRGAAGLRTLLPSLLRAGSGRRKGRDAHVIVKAP